MPVKPKALTEEQVRKIRESPSYKKAAEELHIADGRAKVIKQAKSLEEAMTLAGAGLRAPGADGQGAPPDSSKAPPPKPSSSQKGEVREGGALSESVFLKWVAQQKVSVITPDIYIGYMCAVKRGYQNGLTEWLSLISRYFWLDRSIDPYREVSYGIPEGLGMGEGAGGGKDGE